MKDRFISTRSPIASKYRRVIDGLELKEGIKLTPSASATATEARNGVYKRLFGPEIVNSTPKSIKNGESDFSSFLTCSSGHPQNSIEQKDEINFIAPIKYGKNNNKTSRRPLQSTPIKILDAPGIEDDFYLNLLDWEHKINRVSVLLGGSEVYFWNASNLTRIDEESIISEQSAITSLGRQNSTNLNSGCVIKWSPTGSKLAIGTKNGFVEIWDAERNVRLHNWIGHVGTRCGVLSWAPAGSYEGHLSSGGRDHRVVHYDIRLARGIISGTYAGHTQEVCGLKYDHYGSGLLASGGNDNQLLVWDRRRDQTGPILELNQHVAAVKAIDWSPHQAGLLASGGGTADRTIQFWNTKLPISANINGGNNSNYSSFKPIQASSQVCTLAWSPLSPGEILSTHGFSEHNLALWSYPTGNCLGTLDGHSQRVLFQAMGPDGSTVVTGSGDETLRFWSVFRRPTAGGDQLQNRARNGRNPVDGALENIFQSSR